MFKLKLLCAMRSLNTILTVTLSKSISDAQVEPTTEAKVQQKPNAALKNIQNTKLQVRLHIQ